MNRNHGTREDTFKAFNSLLLFFIRQEIEIENLLPPSHPLSFFSFLLSFLTPSSHSPLLLRLSCYVAQVRLELGILPPQHEQNCCLLTGESTRLSAPLMQPLSHRLTFRNSSSPSLPWIFIFLPKLSRIHTQVLITKVPPFCEYCPSPLPFTA